VQTATHKYFAADQELTAVFHKDGKFFGRPVGVTPTFTAERGWFGDHVQAERVVAYKARPSRHECDARCMNATGRVMKCECACGGKNHGRAAFTCEAA
jgi:hypothetical protein